MKEQIKGFIDIATKKIKFKLNKNLVYLNVDGKLMHRGKIPLLKICNGKGIDVGCGSDKITEKVIGVDITGKGESGKYGCEKNRLSQADIKSSGDNLFMFKDNSLDYVIARENLEHYIDFLKALKEWNRILKMRGKVGITTPNDDQIDSLMLDKSHKHAFNLSSLKTALELAGFKVIENGEIINGWSFYVIGKKIRRVN